MTQSKKYDKYQMVETAVEALMNYKFLVKNALPECFDALDAVGKFDVTEAKKAVDTVADGMYDRLSHEIKELFDFS